MAPACDLFPAYPSLHTKMFNSLKIEIMMDKTVLHVTVDTGKTATNENVIKG